MPPYGRAQRFINTEMLTECGMYGFTAHVLDCEVIWGCRYIRSKVGGGGCNTLICEWYDERRGRSSQQNWYRRHALCDCVWKCVSMQKSKVTMTKTEQKVVIVFPWMATWKRMWALAKYEMTDSFDSKLHLLCCLLWESCDVSIAIHYG